MRDLLVAGALALALHALLFTLKLDWAKGRIPSSTAPQILTLNLAHKENPIQPVWPVAKGMEWEEKSPSLQRASKAKPTKIKPSEPALSAPPKKEETAASAEAPKNDFLLGSVSSYDLPTGMNQGPSGLGLPGTEAGTASIQGGDGGSNKDSLSSSSLRQAIPIYRTNPAPEYPALARRRGYEGTVVAEALVGRDGRVHDLRLVQTSGYSILDQAAMAAIKKWLFEPALEGNEKIDMWVKVPVRFQLE